MEEQRPTQSSTRNESADEQLRGFYRDHHDHITDKRYNSPFWIRRWTHRGIYQRSLKRIEPGEFVLDAGCGEGVLAGLMAEKGAQVIGCDISLPNVIAAKSATDSSGTGVMYLVADSEKLPFKSDTFDTVVSSHVIEHLPHPELGLRELHRVTSDRALIAMPTCLNPSCWALLGRDTYWKLSWKSTFGTLLGFARTVLAFLLRQEGVDEGYGGRRGVVHVFRFPWVITRMTRAAGFRIEKLEAGPLAIPYFCHYIPALRPLQERLDRLGDKRILRNCGNGIHVLARKR
jgi:2-polyprenyl-3-methyl-5-hydroxy-6-metoxy-1,4-benzoquinol methylase